MSRNPNDTTEDKSGAGKSGRKKSQPAKVKPRKKSLSGGDEETPITVSNGSIHVRAGIDLEDKNGKKGKHWKANDTGGKKWTLDRVVIFDDDGVNTYPIVGGDGAIVQVWFKRP